MSKELKQFIKFAYKETCWTYYMLPKEKIKIKVLENLKKLIPLQNELWYGYWNVDFDEVEKLLNTF